MDLQRLFREIDATDWNACAGPTWYMPHRVAPALKALAVVGEEDFSLISGYRPGVDMVRRSLEMGYDLLLNGKVSSDVLFAIGNDHSGTYYPAALAALPFLFRIALEAESDVARNCAVNAIIDLFGFEPATDGFQGPGFGERQLRGEMRRRILGRRDELMALALRERRNKMLVLNFVQLLMEYTMADAREW